MTHEPNQLAKGDFYQSTARPMLEGIHVEESPTDRQERIAGFEQDKAAAAGILSVGAGGLAAEQLPGFARKGYGRLAIVDMDFVTPSNLPRQHFYRPDLFNGKAAALAKNLERECLLETDLLGINIPYQDAITQLDLSKFALGVCNVDNNETRVDFSRDMFKAGKPAIFCGVSADANSGYVFVQESIPGKPCFGCAFPQKINDKRHPCPNTPACKDILKVVGGFVMYAVDSIVMQRPRNWNLQLFYLDGTLPNTTRMAEHRGDCPLCGAATN